MFVLNDKDKSAYGTLKGLVKLIEKDITSAVSQLRLYSEQSRDYAACKGAIGALNGTLGVIFVTDVWVRGKRDEELSNPQPHWHVTGPNNTRCDAYDEGFVRLWLSNSGVRANYDAFGLLAQGFLVRRCEVIDCPELPKTP